MTLQGRVLAGRYALGALLGAGGIARVYRARDRVLQRTVAVKVLSAPHDQDPDLVARFGREARAAAALSHPNIVTIYDSSADSDLHYLVMEYVEGETLAALLADQPEPGRVPSGQDWLYRDGGHASSHGAPDPAREVSEAATLPSSYYPMPALRPSCPGGGSCRPG